MNDPGPTSAAMLHLEVPDGDGEVAADLLWRSGAGAVEERAGADGHVLLVSDADATRVRAGAGPGWRVHEVEVHEDTWRDQWRAWAAPSRVDRVVVQPTWSEAAPVGSDDVVVLLDPQRAFGDGRHPSTRLALAALQAVLSPGATVLDAGCGSGVLAVAARLLGAGRTLGVDLAPAAWAATAANATANGVAVEVGDDLAAVEDRWDVVLANIGAAALVGLAPVLGPLVAPGGVLVLSGLLEAQARPVAAAYDGFVVVDPVHTEDGWAAPVLRRP